ncbi:actin, cytoskeletal 3 isoform X4 [Symphalangus syndactylus]|uniref:actin, cytoskeletal 3 isoform X4 n=1 Tax=Symphalangus syndactylus TaxID=9590 RepID=UPI0030077EB0
MPTGAASSPGDCKERIGGDGRGRLVHWGGGSEKTRETQRAISHFSGNDNQLGQHGEDLASLLLPGAPRRPRAAPHVGDGAAFEPNTQQRESHTGMTVESGEGMTHFLPIADGCPLHQSTFQVDIAGQDLTLYLLQLLKDNGQLLVGTGDREYIRDMKEKCCYVALDFDKEKMKTDSPSCQRKYQLPDGQEITVGQESFFCPEVLFQTKLIGKNTPGIHTMAIQSITSCNPDLQKVLFGHLLLSGGTGSCPGLRFRMQREISELVSPTVYVKVATCPYSVYGAWVGGSILCSLSTFKDMWVTSKEYKEMGSSIISRKSF